MDQKDTFQQLLEQHISSLNKFKKDKYVITQDMYGKILTILQQPKGAKCEEGSNFKFWCNKHFKVEEIGANQDFKWILHARDHFCKYSWTFPLTY